MGDPLLAGVYKEHAKTEDSMIRQLCCPQTISHCFNRFLHVLIPNPEGEHAQEKFQ